jgi:Skp family chaperone for outer membrane proteins
MKLVLFLVLLNCNTYSIHAQVPKIGIIQKDSIIQQSYFFRSTHHTLQNYTFLLQYILEKKQLAGQILLQKFICRPRKCFSLDTIPSDQVLLEQYQANISTLAQQAEQSLLEIETKNPSSHRKSIFNSSR